MARREAQTVDGIIFWSFSRLARDQLDSQFIKADLRRRGYVVHSMTDDIPSGEFAPVIEALIDWKNERFLKDLSKDVRRGLHDLARDGYAPGGFPPRGYLAKKVQIGVKRDGTPRIVSKWVVDPELGPQVKKAFELRAGGASYKEVHEATQIMGTFGSYVTMFRNRTYLGIRKCGELEIEDAHEPLVSCELWDAVQATLRNRPKKGGRWPKGKPHPIRELAISPKMIESTLKPMREALIEGDTRAKRDLLSKVVAKIVTGPTGAELSYTFPLHEMTGMYTAPPWGHIELSTYRFLRQRISLLSRSSLVPEQCSFPRT
jgi:DNA invertase Pin-like site-specific DNA recombinase